MAAPRRIGILTGGGDVPGLNSVIKSVVYRSSELGFDVLGIRLDGELGALRERKVPLDERDRARDARTAKPRRRTAAEIDRVDLRPPLGAEARRELPLERGEILADRHGTAHGDREIAVAAAARAEGNVDVDVAGHIGNIAESHARVRW